MIKKFLFAIGGGLVGLIAGYILSIITVALLHIALRFLIPSLRTNAVPEWERYILTAASLLTLIAATWVGGRHGLKRARRIDSPVT